MNKKLFTQIKNEWRSNLWLAIELLLVSVVMWYIVDSLYCTTATYLEPRGFDISHTYHIEMGILNDKSPDYVVYQSDEELRRDVIELVDRLQHRPDIEAVSLSNAAYPYNGSNSWTPVQLIGDNQTPINIVRRIVTPDFLRVFRYTGVNGETPEQLAQMVEEGKFLLSESFCKDRNLKPNELIGKPFYLHGDTTQMHILGAVLNSVRYSDYQQGDYCLSFVEKLPIDWMDHTQELCVRVRPEYDKEFRARLMADSESQYRIGNIFISNIYSFKDKRRAYQQQQTNDIRNKVTGMSFLMLNVFLGLLGTFWFRTQQRRSEIALHKVHGATKRMVFIRLLSEGLFILLLITPLALLIDFNIAHAELNAFRNGTCLEWDRLLLCVLISFALILAMISIGILIPANKAIQTKPVDALHAE
ncbi:MAG: ABC transporter permease [Bacteroides sp.]|nr:ABC transporter permease [Bacteroides sp.]MBO5381255.1 ABC transporter permease [Bacteroides sp.]